MNSIFDLQSAPMTEAQRQSELLSALFSTQAIQHPVAGVTQRGTDWHRGLAAYRGNGNGHAISALQVQFPTLLAMLGEQAFAQLSLKYWQACPPISGDLAVLGDRLAGFIATVDDLADWPWLADSARLDWALWPTAGIAEPSLTTEALHRMTLHDPEQLSIVLAGHIQLLECDWPTASLWQAHQSTEPDWAHLRDLLIQRKAETLLVWRPTLHDEVRPAMQVLDAPTAQWMFGLQQGQSLARALDAISPDFDFSAWLHTAVQHGWIADIALT